VRVIEDRIGVPGVVAMLERIGAGLPGPAIDDALKEPLSRFILELPARALAGCQQGIFVSAARSDGLRIWLAYGFRPQNSVAVTVDGQGQRYAFHVVTDRYGVYTGTLGTPMPSGSYVLRVTADTGERAQITLALGDRASIAQQGCTQ
jgi:hypothetical protein